jgi:4-alpha-glucanotransferase
VTPLDFHRRASGLLLHPTSLPGRHGSGDLGPAAYAFADFLHEAKQTWWQMLPVNPPGNPPGNSPYSSTSAMAGSAYLISLELLVRDGLLHEQEVAPGNGLNGHINAQFRQAFAFRANRLRVAFERFESQLARHRRLRSAFKSFTEECRDWLDDWSLYAALRHANRDAPWSDWDKPLRLRKPEALRDARRTLAREVRFEQFVQFIFQKQWTALRGYCHARNVGLIGDIPIFVAHDSADVWAHRELFLLDRDGQPKATSGYPPDKFNTAGQSWGHPQYHWPAHAREKFAWWIRRFRHTLELFDGVRIDHFLGFVRAWHVPGGAKDGRRGKWVPSPGKALFKRLWAALPGACDRIIAEDLGQLTPGAVELRDQFGFPGMRVMQFGFGEGGQYHLPHLFPRRCVAYTGTHDNNTIVGWLHELRTTMSLRKHRHRSAEYMKVLRYLHSDGREVHRDFIRSLMASCADTVVFPVQDVLGLDARNRMNTPGTADGNWRWRLTADQLTPHHAARLSEMVELYDRASGEEQKPRRRDGAKDHAKEGDGDGRIRLSGERRIGSR